MTTTGLERASLHVFFDDDSEEYWVAFDLADLRAAIDEAQGPGAFEDNCDGDENCWTRLYGSMKKEIAFTDSPDVGPSAMASEDDDLDDCQLITRPWREWAAWHGRGFFGGGRS